jgi:hypothetical protein
VTVKESVTCDLDFGRADCPSSAEVNEEDYPTRRFGTAAIGCPEVEECAMVGGVLAAPLLVFGANVARRARNPPVGSMPNRSVRVGAI